MTVFICISTYNEGVNLLKTVDSVYSRLHEITDINVGSYVGSDVGNDVCHDVNVIISDDGSTDCSVGECLDKYVDNSCGLKVTKRNEPSGTSAAKAHGADLAISLSGGLEENPYDVLIFLDGHTSLHENCLKRLVDYTIKYGIVCPVLKGIDNKTWEYNGSTSHGAFFCKDNFTTKFIKSQKELKDGPEDNLKLTYRISGGACCIRKDIYLDIGGWDKEVLCFGADTNITLRAWCFGYNIYLALNAITGHVFRKQFRQEVRPSWQQLYSNRLRLVTMLGTQKDLDDIKINLQKKDTSIARKSFKYINSIKDNIPRLQCKLKRSLTDYWNEVSIF